MYYGETQTSLDDKGRMNIPVQFRAVMEAQDHEVWYMTRGFDGAVFMFPTEKWRELLEQRKEASTLDPRMLDFKRLFLGSVAKSKRDRQGRLTIASHLRDYAGVDREAVLLGVEDHLELWNKASWKAFQKSQAQQYKAMAAELFGARNGPAAGKEGGNAGC